MWENNAYLLKLNYWPYQVLTRMKELELSYIGSGNNNSTTTLENSLAASWNLNVRLLHMISIPFPRYSPMVSQNISPCKAYANLLSLICHRQQLERTQMPVSKWMDKWIVIYSYNGMPSQWYTTIQQEKRNEILINSTTWMNHRIIRMSEKRPDTPPPKRDEKN